MNAIEQKTHELIQIIKESDSYRAYEKSLKKVTAQPELKWRVDELRARTFRMYNEPGELDPFEEIDRIEQDHRELRRIPEVNEFLDAEIELCRILKETEDTINMAIEVQIPEM
ncbi:MAG: YlbF family regulator [Ruminococcus sp.]|jgi:cell fate (sporulation/competence/biofilm development) regulator YlbF (YheA/YmcA/DUF963 family)